jgi:hypothetical protein
MTAHDAWIDGGYGDMRRPAEGEPREDNARSASLGDLLGDVSRDLSTLMRQEVELAKAEARQSAQQAGRGAGLLGGAGLAGLLALIFVSLAAWWAIGDAIGLGWSGLIVAAFWLVVAVVLATTGRRQLTRVRGLPQTVRTAKQIPDAVTGKDSGA